MNIRFLRVKLVVMMMVIGIFSSVGVQAQTRARAPIVEFRSEIRETSGGFADQSIIANNRLFIPLQSNGIAIYDITMPSKPRLITRINTQILGFHAYEMVVASNKLYVASDGGLYVLDITNPAQPQFIGSFASIRAYEMVIRGNYLYALGTSFGGNSDGVYAYDIRPAFPTLAGVALVEGLDAGFAVSEAGVVFVGIMPWSSEHAPTAHVEAIDMHNPANPVYLGHWVSPFDDNVILEMSLVNDMLYVGGGRVLVLNIADPAAITLQASYINVGVTALTVASLPPYVFAADVNDQISMLQLNGTSLTSVGTMPTPGHSSTIYLKNQILLVESWNDNMTEKILQLYQVSSGDYQPYQPGITR